MTLHMLHIHDAAKRTRLLWRFVFGGMFCSTMAVWGVTEEKKNETTSKKSEPAASGKKPPLGQITVLVPKKEFKPDGPNQALRITFDDLDMELVLNTRKLSVDLPKQMPEWLKKLDGQRIRIRAYMHPSAAFQEEGIKAFFLCRDTAYFGPHYRCDHLIRITLKTGMTTSYIENKAIDVEGVFRIKPMLDAEIGELDQFYLLDDAQIVPQVIKKAQ